MSSISKSIGSPLVLSTPDISKEPFRRATLVTSMSTGSGSLHSGLMAITGLQPSLLSSHKSRHVLQPLFQFLVFQCFNFVNYSLTVSMFHCYFIYRLKLVIAGSF